MGSRDNHTTLTPAGIDALFNGMDLDGLRRAVTELVDEVADLRVRMRKVRGAVEKAEATGRCARNALDTQVWKHIVSFLVPPRPKPLSGQTRQEYEYLRSHEDEAIRRLPDSFPDQSQPGCVKRADIRCGDLATLMRVSSSFNNIAGPLLYEHIICDSLPLLIVGVPTSTTPSGNNRVQSKTQLLQHCRTLQLEYSNKSMMSDKIRPFYDLVMHHGARIWAETDRHHNPCFAAEMEAKLEAVTVLECLLDLLRPTPASGDTARVWFPRLTRLSIGAIFGPQEELWAGIQAPNRGIVKHYDPLCTTLAPVEFNIIGFIDQCRLAAMKVFRQSPLIHYCQRSFTGPLAAPFCFDWNDSVPGVPITQSQLRTPAATIPSFTMHMVLDSILSPRAAIGQPTQWLIETPFPSDTPESVERKGTERLEEYCHLLEHMGVNEPDLDVVFSLLRYDPQICHSGRYVESEENDYSWRLGTRAKLCAACGLEGREFEMAGGFEVDVEPEEAEVEVEDDREESWDGDFTQKGKGKGRRRKMRQSVAKGSEGK